MYSCGRFERTSCLVLEDGKETSCLALEECDHLSYGFTITTIVP
jgi:hypothetical protein